MNEKIITALESFPADKRVLVNILREIILGVTGIEETVKWNQLTYVSGKKNLCFIYTYKKADYINLGFMHATSLNDPKNLFEGTGKGMRHVKIRTEKDIPIAQVRKWVKEAAALSEKKKPASKKKS